MKILDPQSATLTNVEVLAHFTANPPRRSPNPPANSRNFTPKPDLRDHNTVVKEIHNYVSRLAPHLLSYPKYTHDIPEPPAPAPAPTIIATETTTDLPPVATSPAATSHPEKSQGHEKPQQQPLVQQQHDLPAPLPAPQSQEPTDLDIALQELITELKPFGLTKAEVIMIIDLGIGLDGKEGSVADGEEKDNENEGENEDTKVDGDGDVAMDAEDAAQTTVQDEMVDAGAQEGGGGEELQEEEDEEEGIEADYGITALLDTVIEDREERLTPGDIVQILGIVNEKLGSKSRKGRRSEGGEDGAIS